MYQDHLSMVCTSKVFMGDSDKVEGSEQMVKLAIQQFGFWIGRSFAREVVTEMAAKASNVADKSSLGMNEYVYQSVTVQAGLLLWYGWIQNKPLSIDIEGKRKKMYCCNDDTNNPRGSIPPNEYRISDGRRA